MTSIVASVLGIWCNKSRSERRRTMDNPSTSWTMLSPNSCPVPTFKLMSSTYTKIVDFEALQITNHISTPIRLTRLLSWTRYEVSQVYITSLEIADTLFCLTRTIAKGLFQLDPPFKKKLIDLLIYRKQEINKYVNNWDIDLVHWIFRSNNNQLQCLT